ncbi:MAG: hypothetical protein H7Z14_17975, partial [Anaerolineae bacterium]|nr:hypothetical protein [Phycisphaerae bacterium]
MLLISFALIALAISGHLLITRASMGFGYTLGIRKRGWHLLAITHAIIGVTVPILLIIYVGLRGPAMLRGGAWTNVPLLWLVYMAICVAAVAVGAIVNYLRHRERVPAVFRSNHTMTRNAVTELGRIPAPLTLSGKLARISGNENFRVDFRTVDVTIPRLPESLDGLSILHLTDLHFHGTPDRTFFEWAAQICDEQKPDLVALTGDIADDLTLLEWLPTTLGRLTRISRNENFRVDFRTVDVTIPRLPESLDGLSILHLTDLHFHG